MASQRSKVKGCRRNSPEVQPKALKYHLRRISSRCHRDTWSGMTARAAEIDIGHRGFVFPELWNRAQRAILIGEKRSVSERTSYRADDFARNVDRRSVTFVPALVRGHSAACLVAAMPRCVLRRSRSRRSDATGSGSFKSRSQPSPLVPGPRPWTGTAPAGQVRAVVDPRRPAARPPADIRAPACGCDTPRAPHDARR